MIETDDCLRLWSFEMHTASVILYSAFFEQPAEGFRKPSFDFTETVQPCIFTLETLIYSDQRESILLASLFLQCFSAPRSAVCCIQRFPEDKVCTSDHRRS